MAENDVLRWFYLRYLETPKKYFAIKDVCKSLNMAYPSCRKMVKRLAFFDWVQAATPESLFYDGDAKHLYRLHANKRNRCKMMFHAEKTIKSYHLRADNDIYLSSKVLEEEKSGAMERLL